MATTTQPTTEREHYLAAFAREYEITLRVLKAYPAPQASLRWTERSNSAMQVAWTLVMSQAVIAPILHEPALAANFKFPEAPNDWNTLVTAFETEHARASALLAASTSAQLETTIVMPVGPGGATAPVRRADALWMMLFDTVHHRGQLSVFLRATGARVPSIYGPSGDEPWM